MPDVSAQKWKAHREDHLGAFQLAGDYAKWFIASFVLLPSGAIAFVVQHHGGKNYACPVALFGLAIIFALGAGIVGWINLQCASIYYGELAGDVLEGRLERQRPFLIDLFGLASLALITVSAIFFFVGAYILWHLLFFGPTP